MIEIIIDVILVILTLSATVFVSYKAGIIEGRNQRDREAIREYEALANRLDEMLIALDNYSKEKE